MSPFFFMITSNPAFAGAEGIEGRLVSGVCAYMPAVKHSRETIKKSSSVKNFFITSCCDWVNRLISYISKHSVGKSYPLTGISYVA